MDRLQESYARIKGEQGECTCGNLQNPRSLKFASIYAKLKSDKDADKTQELQFLPPDLLEILLILAASMRKPEAMKQICQIYPKDTFIIGDLMRHFCKKCVFEMKLRKYCDVIGQCFQDMLKIEAPLHIKLVELYRGTEINGVAVKQGRLKVQKPLTIRGKVTFKDFNRDYDTGNIFLRLMEENDNSTLKLNVTEATLLWSFNDTQDSVASAILSLPSELSAIELKGGASVCYGGVTSLRRLKQLKKLTLELNDPSGIVTAKVAEVCKDLSLNYFESTHKTFRGLKRFLENTKELKSLSLTNSVTEEDLMDILNSSHVSTIIDLYLCLNNFSQSIMILPLVVSMPQLQFLDLTYCEIEKEVLILICTGIINFKNLRSVRLKQFHLRLKRVASYEVAESVLQLMTSSKSKQLMEITVDATNNKVFEELCRRILSESGFSNLYGVILVNSFSFPVSKTS